MFFGARCLWRQRDVVGAGEGKSGKLLQTHRISFNGGLTQKLNYGKFLSLLYPNSTHLIFHPFDHSISFLRLPPTRPSEQHTQNSHDEQAAEERKVFKSIFIIFPRHPFNLIRIFGDFWGYFGDRSRVTCVKKCNNVFSWEYTETFYSVSVKK